MTEELKNVVKQLDLILNGKVILLDDYSTPVSKKWVNDKLDNLNTGTVTSVGLNSGNSYIEVTGSPVTSSGVLNLKIKDQSSPNLFLGVSDSAPHTTLFRTIQASDIPVIPVNKGGTNLTSLGAANNFMVVNSGGTALQYRTIALSDLPTITVSKGGTNIVDLTGLNGQYLRVNSGGTGYETASISGLLSGLTSGRVPYANGATSLSDSANFKWDNSNISLQLGNPTPGVLPSLLEILPISGRAAIRLHSNTAPSSPANGELWYQSANTEFVFAGALRPITSGTTNTFLRLATHNLANYDTLLGTVGIGTTTIGNIIIGATVNSNFVLFKSYGTSSSGQRPVLKTFHTGNSTFNQTFGENGGISSVHSLHTLEHYHNTGSGTITSSTPFVLNSYFFKLLRQFGSNSVLMSDYTYLNNGDSIGGSPSGNITGLAFIKHGPIRIRENFASSTIRFTNAAWGVVHSEATGVHGLLASNGNAYGLLVGALSGSNGTTNSNFYGIRILDYSGTSVTLPFNITGGNASLDAYSNRWQLYLEGTNPTNVASYIGAKLGIGHSSNPTSSTNDITALLDLGVVTTAVPQLRLRRASGATNPGTITTGSIWNNNTGLFYSHQGLSNSNQHTINLTSGASVYRDIDNVRTNSLGTTTLWTVQESGVYRVTVILTRGTGAGTGTLASLTLGFTTRSTAYTISPTVNSNNDLSSIQYSVFTFDIYSDISTNITLAYVFNDAQNHNLNAVIQRL